ncbi:MAG: heat-shock protein Hsp20 [Gammaproteobacteria bacterium SG8_47]|nr:MAG: heat-shock protein Hsp20 [Gammaproteobacteria bacterium SG8_47]
MYGLLGNSEGNLFDEFRRMEREMNQLFGAGPWPTGIRAVARGTYPPINVGGTAEQVDVYVFAAGLDPATLDVSIQQNLLTIAGERRLITEEGADYYRRERFDGQFRRVLSLPDDVDPGKVQADYRDGVLHITALRRESTKPRQIEVK